MMWLIGKTIAAFFAAAAFGVLFGVRRQNLAFAGLCGMAGGLVFLLLENVGSLPALLCAGVAIAACSEVLARLRHCPATVFLIPGIIPLVPGGRIYMAMQLAITGVPGEAAMMLYTLLLEAGALALGIILVASVTALRRGKPGA